MKLENALVGTTIQLKVTYSGKATGYTWTKGNTRVADWDDPLDVTYFETLKRRCELDTTTGTLTIRDLKEEDAARYKGEALVSNTYVSSNYDLRVFPSLNKPMVTCNVIGGNYTILCDHQPDPPTYMWLSKDGLVTGTKANYWLTNFNKTLTLTSAKVPFQPLECVVQNPVSNKSTPVPQDCFKGLISNAEENRRRDGLIIFAVIGSIVILAVCIGIFLWRKFGKSLPQCLGRHGFDTKDSAEQSPLVSDVNAAVGATVRLTLKHTGEAKGYIWTKENETIAECDSHGEVSYHDALKDRCELSTSTGELTIRDLRVADSSRYKGEALLDSGSSVTDIHLSVSDESTCQGPGNDVPQSGSGEGGNADDPDQRSNLQEAKLQVISAGDPKNEKIEYESEAVNDRPSPQHSLSSGEKGDETLETKNEDG